MSKNIVVSGKYQNYLIEENNGTLFLVSKDVTHPDVVRLDCNTVQRIESTNENMGAGSKKKNVKISSIVVFWKDTGKSLLEVDKKFAKLLSYLAFNVQ